jgi:tetratricopeptide (TPR) repeat protein
MNRSTRLPYPGLRPFRRNESDLFFGREGCVDDMVDRLRATRFLAVLGASGSGKSSLVATGLLDALELGLLAPAGSHWQVARFRPGGEPIRNLAAALVGPSGEQPTDVGADVQQEIELLASFLRRGPRSVVQWCLDGNLPCGCNLLILVDQFEELFRYGNYARREEAEAFVALLIASAQAEDVSIHVVITLRSEYLGACALIPGLAERINSGLYLTPRMTRDQVRQAIEGPARVCGFAIEPALVSRLLNDLSGFAPWEDDSSDDELQRLSRQSDQLPLMQHVLNRLWLRANEAAGGGSVRLRLRDYEQLGGLRGALDTHAREVFESLPDHDRPIVEIVFRALISGTSVANAIRRPCQYGELLDLAQGDRAAVDRVVQAFRAADCNFLTTDRRIGQDRPPPSVALDDRAVVDISHESLIRQWSDLSDWLDKEVRAAAFWRRLVAAAESYDRGEGDLLRGADLAYSVASWMREKPTVAWARRHGNLFAQAKQFLDRSQAAEIDQTAAERRRLLRSRAIFAGSSVIIFVLMVAAVLKGLEAKTEADRANSGVRVAIQAVASLADTSGNNIDAVIENADRMLKRVVKANSVEQGAELLLKFASTSEWLGDYPRQNERSMRARDLLLPICEGTQATSCVSLLASTYDAEGDYLSNVGKRQEAIGAYQQALERRKHLAGEGAADDLVLAQAGTQAALSRALLATRGPESGLGAAKECSAMVERIGAGSGPAQFAKATCELIETEALRAMKNTEDAIGKANDALSLLASIQTSPPDVRHVAQTARARKQLGLAYLDLRDRANALDQLENAIADLRPIALSNPQNDRIADLLAELFQLQGKTYGQADRNDLAVEAWRGRVELAKNRRGGFRASHWKEIERDSLTNLRLRYAALDRHREALETAKAEIRLLLEDTNRQPGVVPYPAPLLQVMVDAAREALEISDGVKAFEYFGQAFEHAERHLALLREAGRNPETEYSPFSEIVFDAVSGLSQITRQELSKDQQVAVLTRIVDIIARSAADEPRVIPFRIAEGRSRYQLADALEVAGDLPGAREMHELASKAGSKTSTIVLRRWYMEGFAGTVRDYQRARELETLAAGQGVPPTFHIELRSRADSAVRSEDVYFREPGDGDPLADEAYRLARYKNAEFTDAGRNHAMRIYEFARDNKLTFAEVSQLIEQDTRLPRTTVSADVDRAREALNNKRVEDAYKLIVAAKEPLESPATDPSNVIAWGVIAEASSELARSPETARDPQLAARVQRLRDEAIAKPFAVHPDGSSPRMKLAANLEQLARRAQETEEYDDAVRLYNRAIDLRNLVRAHDPNNAECHCGIAGNYRSIGRIEEKRGNFDAAVVSFQRALHIYENLQRLEPNTAWSGYVAVTARDLAEVLGKRGESQSALMHAATAAFIYRGFAERHSADSDTRIGYADSLERVARFARAVANLNKSSDFKLADSYFQSAVTKLVEANEIRESVLLVDSGRDDCRCHVGGNYMHLANIYADWGKTSERSEAIDRAVQVYRELRQNQPEVRKWQYNLARSLLTRATATSESKNSHEAVLADYREASMLLRSLQSDSDRKDFPDATEMLIRSLADASHHALFARQDKEALAAAEEVLQLSPGELWSMRTKAHALMYLGRTDEALRIYLEHKGKPLRSKTWDDYIAEDFAELKAAGRAHPLMDRVPVPTANVVR